MWPSVRHIRLLETTGNQPEQLYGQAILLRDNYLYVIGGTTGHEFLCDIYRYEPFFFLQFWSLVDDEPNR